MRVYWCDVRPLLAEAEPFVRWCGRQGADLGDYLCLGDAIRHLAGLRLREIAGQAGDWAAVSVSHGGGLAVCACGGGPLGIDAEEVVPPAGDLPLAWFTAGERAWLARQQHPLRAFFRLWTRKESLIKAENRVLADLPLLPSLVEGGVLLDRVGGLAVRELSLLPRYVTSIAAGDEGGAELIRLPVSEIFPG